MAEYEVIFNPKQMDVIEHIIFEYDTICHFGLDYPCLYYKENTQEGLEYPSTDVFEDILSIETERSLKYLIKFVQRDMRFLRKKIKKFQSSFSLSDWEQELEIHDQILKILKKTKSTFSKGG